MGNFTSCRPSGRPAGKVVLSDGTVQKLDHPISVAELMLEHPHHFVVELRSPSAATSTKPTPLPADHNLDASKVYMVLPMARGKNVGLTAGEIQRILSTTTRSALRSRSFPSLPTICMENAATKEKEMNILRRTGSDLVGSMDKELVRAGALEWSPEVLDERPEYLSKQFSCKGWKPSLGTIEERALEKKVPHWLF